VGGYGSGPSGHWSKATVEGCLNLDIRELYRTRGADGLSRTCTWYRDGEKTGAITWRIAGGYLHLAYTVTDRDGEKREQDYKALITWTPCNYGGRRPWLICPERNCPRRVAKLYKPPGGDLFLCRHCWNLVYESQRERRSLRLVYKAQDIHRRLGGGPGLGGPFPERPKGMHRATYERLRWEAEELEADSWGALAQEANLLSGVFADRGN
jgi:hypothetical protein